MSLIIACGIGLQPVCDRGQFEKACGGVLRGEHKSIGYAIFEAYLDQVKEINETDQLLASQEAASLLVNFADSLSQLDGGGSWRKASSLLRRSVLLQSRQAANPWLATVWVDLSQLDSITVSEETNAAIDLFLQQEYDKDLEERYSAFEAINNGNSQRCEQLTANVMKLWVTYQQLIEPYMSISAVQFAAYPKLNTGHRVRAEMTQLDTSNSPRLEQRFQEWSTWHKRQTEATIALIRSARSSFLFDPCSTRCGVSSNKQAIKLQQQLLQLSATVRDKNSLAIESLKMIAHETQ